MYDMEVEEDCVFYGSTPTTVRAAHLLAIYCLLKKIQKEKKSRKHLLSQAYFFNPLNSAYFHSLLFNCL